MGRVGLRFANDPATTVMNRSALRRRAAVRHRLHRVAAAAARFPRASSLSPAPAPARWRVPARMMRATPCRSVSVADRSVNKMLLVDGDRGRKVAGPCGCFSKRTVMCSICAAHSKLCAGVPAALLHGFQSGPRVEVPPPDAGRQLLPARSLAYNSQPQSPAGPWLHHAGTRST